MFHHASMNPEVHVQTVEQMEGDYLYKRENVPHPILLVVCASRLSIQSVIKRFRKRDEGLKPIMSNSTKRRGKTWSGIILPIACFILLTDTVKYFVRTRRRAHPSILNSGWVQLLLEGVFTHHVLEGDNEWIKESIMAEEVPFPEDSVLHVLKHGRK